MAHVAFIGLGTMGLPMAKNLLKAGHNVIGFDMSEAARNELKEAGGNPTTTLAKAVADAEAVITMLPSSAIVREVFLGKDGILAHCQKSAVLMDSSTIDVETARDLIATAADRGIVMLDAPVSGAMAAAVAGTLVFMVGGSAEGFKRAEPILAGMGRESIHIGGPGTGQATKICNNVLTGIHIAAASESLALGQKFGLDLKVLADVIGKSSGGSWIMANYCPAAGVVENAPSTNKYKPGFASTLMAKDVGLFLEAAQKQGLPTPVASAARSMYQLAVNNGLADKDCSVVFELLGGRNS